jgi:hypothetical protein
MIQCEWPGKKKRSHQSVNRMMTKSNGLSKK